MENAVGLDFALSRFGPKRGLTCIFAWFYVFIRKITDRFRSQFATRWVAIFLTQKGPKHATVACSFAAWGEKGSGCKAPFCLRWEMKAPREQKTTPNLNFHIVFLSCVKAIEEPQHRLGKIPVASCLDPWVLRKGRLPAFLQRYCVCIEGKPVLGCVFLV